MKLKIGMRVTGVEIHNRQFDDIKILRINDKFNNGVINITIYSPTADKERIGHDGKGLSSTLQSWGCWNIMIENGGHCAIYPNMKIYCDSKIRSIPIERS